jgi:hypothetical protein
LEQPVPKSEGSARSTNEPELHLETTGKVRHAYLRYAGKMTRVRVPLHIYHMPEDRQAVHLAGVARRLKDKFQRDHGIRLP